MIITRTPLRISLMGGGTDMPSFYSKSPGAVISFAIKKYIYVLVNDRYNDTYRISYSGTEECENLDDIKHNLVREALRISSVKHGMEVTTIAELPGRGTGLGSSSTLTVGLLKAFQQKVDPGTLAERAFIVEAEKCSSPVGKQDHYAAAHGGMNFILFGKNRVSVQPIRPSNEWLHDFSMYSLLLWTGVSRDANTILREQRKAFDVGGSMGIGRQLAGLAHDMYAEIAQAASMRTIGELLDHGWKKKKQLANPITNKQIDEWYDKALGAGAYGGKLLGAGGGGFFFFIAPNYLHKRISETTGLQKIPFEIDWEGSVVI